MLFLMKKSSALSYTLQPYAKDLAMCLSMSYTLYATSSTGKTDNIITFVQFEEGHLFSETHNLLSGSSVDTESGNKSDDNSTMPPLIIE